MSYKMNKIFFYFFSLEKVKKWENLIREKKMKS